MTAGVGQYRTATQQCRRLSVSGVSWTSSQCAFILVPPHAKPSLYRSVCGRSFTSSEVHFISFPFSLSHGRVRRSDKINGRPFGDVTAQPFDHHDRAGVKSFDLRISAQRAEFSSP
jgi:hypothetical protein